MKKPLAQPWHAERGPARSVPRGDGDACGIEPQAHRRDGPAWERPGARPARLINKLLASLALVLCAHAAGAATQLFPLDPDRLLAPFRREAGLPVPALLRPATGGKTGVEFVARPGSIAGGLYGLRRLR